MKRLLVAVAVVVVAMAMAVSPAGAVDMSMGIHAGIANPSLSCDGCDRLSVNHQSDYGVELRAFTPVWRSVSLGGEVAYDMTGRGNVRVDGAKVGTVRDHAWSLMPMVKVNVIKKLDVYAGAGIVQSRIKVTDSETGEGVSSTDRVAFISKVGAEYQIYKSLGVYAQWQYLKSDHIIYGTDVDYSQHAGQIGLAYHF